VAPKFLGPILLLDDVGETQVAAPLLPPNELGLYRRGNAVYIRIGSGPEIIVQSGMTPDVLTLLGDVTGNTGESVVSFVGGQSASSVAAAAIAVANATNSNIPGTLVERNGSGDFSAGTITASLVGNVSGNVSGSAASFTGSLSGDVVGTQSSTEVSFVGGKTASSVAAAVTTVGAATSSDTPSTLIERDVSGNFSAGTITANLTGNISGTAANITGIASILHGGSGEATQQAAITALTGTQTAGYYLRSNGTNALLATIQAADLPDLSGTYVTQAEVGVANGVASLNASGKIPLGQLPADIFIYQGSWNPSTNTPSLADGSGVAGYVYWVTTAFAGPVAGLTNASMINFQIGDLVLYSGTQWELTTPAAGVQSVNGCPGCRSPLMPSISSPATSRLARHPVANRKQRL
jgi:hypothetical protein